MTTMLPLPMGFNVSPTPVIQTAGSAPVPAPTDYVGYWSFDESGNWADAVSGQVMFVGGSPSSVSGHKNNAVQFLHAPDEIAWGDMWIQPTAGVWSSWTISIWVKLDGDAGGNGYAVHAVSDYPGIYLLLGWNTNTDGTSSIQYTLNDTGTGNSAELQYNDTLANPMIGTGWHHICIVFNVETGSGDGFVKLFIDGALVPGPGGQYNSPGGINAFPFSDPNFSQQIKTGRFAFGLIYGDDATSFSDGCVDECKIFQRAISDAEVAAIFNE